MMKITRLLKIVFFAVVLAVSTEAVMLLAAEKKPEKADANTPAQGIASERPEGQNVEKLLYTLNETLEENRKIRQSMRDLQEAFEKVTLEKSDAVEQMKKVEKMAIQRNKETGQRIDELSSQLEASKKEMEKLQAGNKTSVNEKLEVEKKLESISAENAKMQELMKSSILAPERDQIVDRMKKNEVAVRNAVRQVSSMDGENIALKAKLVQSYFELGNMFYDLGRYQDAEVQYRHVLEWDPYYAWAYHNLAVICDFHLHKIPEARTYYEKYLQLKSPDEEAREARMRLWDLKQLSNVTPGQPLKQDFDKYQKMPQA